MPTASLSFSVSPVTQAADLRDLCEVRANSYGHHLPGLKEVLLQPDEVDYSPSAINFLARDKRTGAAIGGMRVQVGDLAPPLIETCVTVPQDMQGDLRAELARFSAVAGADPLVKIALMKAAFVYCLSRQVQWMVIGARSEALCRTYRALGFTALVDGAEPTPLTYAGGIPHHVLKFNVQTAERRWHESNHRLHAFMFSTHHPDILVTPPIRLARPQPSVEREAAAAHA